MKKIHEEVEKRQIVDKTKKKCNFHKLLTRIINIKHLILENLMTNFGFLTEIIELSQNHYWNPTV